MARPAERLEAEVKNVCEKVAVGHCNKDFVVVAMAIVQRYWCDTINM